MFGDLVNQLRLGGLNQSIKAEGMDPHPGSDLLDMTVIEKLPMGPRSAFPSQAPLGDARPEREGDLSNVTEPLRG